MVNVGDWYTGVSGLSYRYTQDDINKMNKTPTIVPDKNVIKNLSLIDSVASKDSELGYKNELNTIILPSAKIENDDVKIITGQEINTEKTDILKQMLLDRGLDYEYELNLLQKQNKTFNQGIVDMYSNNYDWLQTIQTKFKSFKDDMNDKGIAGIGSDIFFGQGNTETKQNANMLMYGLIALTAIVLLKK